MLIEKWLPKIPSFINDIDLWDTLVIDKRKPFTQRAFMHLLDGNRLCLHRFEPCEQHDAFAHPHSWPAEFLVVTGEYKETIWHTINDSYNPDQEGVLPVCESIYGAGSWHKIDNPSVWHKIQPISTTYTIMINGLPYPNVSPWVKTTKGKDLKTLERWQLQELLGVFRLYL